MPDKERRVQLSRKDDTEENRQLYRQESRRGRARTVVWAALVAGLVSLLVGRAVEVNTANQTVDLSRTNCKALVEVSRVLAEVAGDVSINSADEGVAKRWTMYKEIFESAAPPLAPSCERLFPKRSYIPFID